MRVIHASRSIRAADSDIRTAAADALAARTLARPDSATVGVLGTGVQAYLQILAAADELPIREVRVWGRRDERVHRLAAALVTRRPDLRVTPVGTARQACEGAPVRDIGASVLVAAGDAERRGRGRMDPARHRRVDPARGGRPEGAAGAGGQPGRGPDGPGHRRPVRGGPAR
ncbi:hypothetical protein [Streptomyces sp. NPDC002516]